MSTRSETPDDEREAVVLTNEPVPTSGQRLRQAFAQQCSAYERKAELQNAESDKMKEVGDVHFLSSEKSKRSFGVR